MENNSDIKLKLLQTTEKFVRDFYYELPKAGRIHEKIKRMIKRKICRATKFLLSPYAEQMLKFQESICELSGMYIDKFDYVDANIRDLKRMNSEKENMEQKLQNHEEAIYNLTNKFNHVNENIWDLERLNNEKENIGQKLWNHEEAIYKLTNRYNETANLVLHLSDENAKINQYLFKDDTAAAKSYSQAGEDMIISYILRSLGEKKQGYSYLDIGCNRYDELNNTFYFYKKGIRGVLVDANPRFIKEIQENRPEDTVLNVGVGINSGECLTFYVMNWDWLSSFNRNVIEETMKESPWVKIEQEIEIPVMTVNEICEKFFESTPTIVSIDVEGDELQILQSVDMERYRPLIYVIETIEYKEKMDINNKRVDVVSYMSSQHYKEYAFTGVNSIFVDEKQF